jgi:hypothetical protein
MSHIPSELKAALDNHSHTTTSIEKFKNGMEKFFALYLAQTQIKDAGSVEDNALVIED